jgi:oxygen-dependent protoporphyrinogen oxidase
MALDLVLPRRANGDEQHSRRSCAARLGQEALERVAQPLVGGIYSGDPEMLSSPRRCRASSRWSAGTGA